jgi:hypothetical protein
MEPLDPTLYNIIKSIESKIFKKTNVFNIVKYRLTWQGDLVALILAAVVVYTIIVLCVERT